MNWVLESGSFSPFCCRNLSSFQAPRNQTDHRETVRDNHWPEMSWQGEIISEWAKLPLINRLGMGNLLGPSFRTVWMLGEPLTHGKVRWQLVRGGWDMAQWVQVTLGFFLWDLLVNIHYWFLTHVASIIRWVLTLPMPSSWRSSAFWHGRGLATPFSSHLLP